MGCLASLTDILIQKIDWPGISYPKFHQRNWHARTRSLVVCDSDFTPSTTVDCLHSRKRAHPLARCQSVVLPPAWLFSPLVPPPVPSSDCQGCPLGLPASAWLQGRAASERSQPPGHCPPHCLKRLGRPPLLRRKRRNENCM